MVRLRHTYIAEVGGDGDGVRMHGGIDQQVCIICCRSAESLPYWSSAIVISKARGDGDVS
jgi:MOSC domain-containing protein YiiM